MGIGNDILDDSVPASRFGVGEPIVESALFRIFNPMVQIAPLLVAEGFSIRNEQLKIARIGTIDIGIINLINNAVAQSEPDPAAGMVSSADALFGAARPARFGARSAKSQRVVRMIHNWIDI